MVEGYPDSLGGWGAPAIFKEAGRLLGKYFRLLHPFILAFLLPVALTKMLELLGLAWIFSHRPHHHHHHHHHHHPHLPFPFPFPPHHHHPFGGSFHHAFYSPAAHEGGYGSYGSAEDAFAPSPARPPHPPHPPLAALLVSAAVAVLTWVLLNLAVAAISKAVEYVYSNQREEDPSPVRSIFRSLPQALYRLFITALWLLLLTALTVLLVSLPFKVAHLVLSHTHHKAHRILALLNKLFVSLALLLLAFVFLLAQEVAVLEPQNYGRAALKRSWHLVKSKLPAALLLFFAYVVVSGGLSQLAHLVVFLVASGILPFWTVYVLAPLFALLFLLLTAYILVATVVLYFASKVKWESEDGGYLPVNSGDVGDNPYTPLVVPAEN